MAANNPPVPDDRFLQYKALSRDFVHKGVIVPSDHESAPSVAPTQIMTTIFDDYIGVGFRSNLSWIMTDYCSMMGIAPSQLVLRAWGLIHSLQVLSDISSLEITAKMVVNAFRLVRVEGNNRRFNLELRVGSVSHVLPPMWLDANADGGHYFYVIHRGIGKTRHMWLDIGIVPEDIIPAETFPETLLDLEDIYRDPAFLLHPRIVNRSSLNHSDESPFIPPAGFENLHPLRMEYEFHILPREDFPETPGKWDEEVPAPPTASTSQGLVIATVPSKLLRENKFLAREILACRRRLEHMQACFVQVEQELRRTHPRDHAESSRNATARRQQTRANQEAGSSRNVTATRPTQDVESSRNEAGTSRNVKPRRS